MAKPGKQKEPIALGRLGDAIGFRLRRLQNQFSRDFQAKSKALDLRSGMFSALEIIRANPGISQTDLAREIGMDKSVIVSLIDDLEKRGWTVRARSESDRRRHQLSVTPEGLSVLDTLVGNMEHVEMIGLAALTPKERDGLIQALDKVYRAYVRPLA